ncbi:MAG TPA: SET domain-containing protein-lysine N-methyltransferase [Geminicoccaceae bacterium]|nr:SET domain-containing protein-lysine N-methyltransferase [Geminicoccaceae bacterium]
MRSDIFFSHNPFADLVEVRPSSYHGWGVFAKVFLPAGTAWWQARPQDALIIEQSQYETLSASAQTPLTTQLLEAILTFSYYPADLKQLVLILDGGRFANHSYTPNSVDNPSKLQSVALRDINAGEEIVEDYSRFGECPWAPLYGEFGTTIWRRNK